MMLPTKEDIHIARNADWQIRLIAIALGMSLLQSPKGVAAQPNHSSSQSDLPLALRTSQEPRRSNLLSNARKFFFRPRKRMGPTHANETYGECSMCLENFDGTRETVASHPYEEKPETQHLFHKDELADWVKKHNKTSCPYCRQDITPHVVKYLRR